MYIGMYKRGKWFCFLELEGGKIGAWVTPFAFQETIMWAAPAKSGPAPLHRSSVANLMQYPDHLQYLL